MIIYFLEEKKKKKKKKGGGGGGSQVNTRSTLKKHNVDHNIGLRRNMASLAKW